MMNKFKEAKGKLVQSSGFRAMKATQIAEEISNKEESQKQARIQASNVRMAAAQAAKKSF